MVKVGEFVCHKCFPEEYGVGTVKAAEKDGSVLVSWENEFGDTWDEIMDEIDLDIEKELLEPELE